MQYNILEILSKVGEKMNSLTHRLRRIGILLLTVLLLTGTALADVPCYVNANTRVYNAPSYSAATINIPAGLPVYMSAFTDTWALVRYNSAYAFIPLRNLVLANPLVVYATKNTHLYRSASSSSNRLTSITTGTPMYILGRDGNFFAVCNLARNAFGFVSVSCVSPNQPHTPSSPDTPANPLISTTSEYYPSMSAAQKLEHAIYIAQTVYGRPYSSNPNVPKSFDCSQFVKYCFDRVEVSLSRSAQDQGYDSRFATIMDKSKLRRGDVVCFNTNTSDGDACDHTGIYLGYGYFVHASSGAGKVIVSSMSSGYYDDAFSWAKRIL